MTTTTDTTTGTGFTAPACGSAVAVAERVRGLCHTRDDADRQVLFQATVWADLHPAEDTHLVVGPEEVDEVSGVFLDQITRPGVAWDAGAGFAAVLGLRSGAGEAFLDEALELRHRLPGVWARVLAGQVQAWRARRIAQYTLHEPDQVAAAVDERLAGVAERVGVTTLGRILDEVVLRVDPERSREARWAGLASRYVRVLQRCNAAGVAELVIQADAADVHDFDHTVNELADALAASPGWEGQDWPIEGRPCRDVLRSIAVGILADPARALAILSGDPDPACPTNPTEKTDQNDPTEKTNPTEKNEKTGKTDPRPGSAGESGKSDPQPGSSSGSKGASSWRAAKRVELVVHIAEDALRGCAGAVGRVAVHGGTPIPAEVVRQWCGRPGAAITIRPVIDATGHEQVEAYEIPERIKARTDARDHSCVFPYCQRPARACDHDHNIPHAAGGATCECNTAPLCRRHHRLKTHTAWAYTTLEPGAYLWASPTGDRYLRDNQGTGNITPQIRPRHNGCFQPRAPGAGPSGSDPPCPET